MRKNFFINIFCILSIIFYIDFCFADDFYIPFLNMVISTWTIDLWILNSETYSTWSINIEIGTNAAYWVNINVKSGTWWLRSTSNKSIINNLTADWIAESYKFSSALNAASDSSATWFIQVADLNVEVNNNISSYTIYSTNKPESSSWVDDVTFYVSVKISDETPAAKTYMDIITITVVWNF